MIRISHALVLLMAVWCAGLLVWTSQSVQKTEKELSTIQYEKIAEVEAVRVLLSEWEYLNRPSRLEALIEDYQFVENNKSTDSKILASVSDIKMPVIPSVPRIKPDRLLTRVSTQGAMKKMDQPKAVVRINKEEKFGSVINDLINEESINAE